MRLVEQSGLPYVLDMVALRESLAPARAPGLHLSTIIQHMIEAAGVRTFRKGGEEEASGLQELFWEMGNAWEDALSKVLAWRYPGSTKPEARQCDGVWCTPDWYRPRSRTLDEIKFTWTKASGPESKKVRGYLWQLESYMHVWGVTRGVLHVAYARGNYRDLPVEYRTYTLHATREELAESWADKIAYATDVGLLAA